MFSFVSIVEPPDMLTPHQAEALGIDRHLSVTANAGAGKTTVLVRRYIDIVRSGSARVHEVVAITFTDKAASELRKKIAEELEARIRDGSASGAEGPRLIAARNQLASATIGTIHSFCAQILREYPVEADVDAAFTVLEGPDQQRILQEALGELLSSLFERKGTGEYEQVANAVRILGKKAFQRYVLYFLSNREKMERLTAPPAGVYREGRGDEEILGSWRGAVEQELVRTFTDARWLSALDSVLGAATGKKKREAAELAGAFLSAPPGKKLGALGALTGVLFTKDGTLRKDVTGRGNAAEAMGPSADELCATYDGSLELLQAALDGDGASGDGVLLRTTRTLLEVYRRAAALYEERKQEHGGLDFEDLQLKTRNLLNDPSIRARLAERYRFVMVDEFQDTNQLQYDILRLLVAEYAGANLFIVGDPKQSIYGFRNAEVEVFSSAKDDIVRSAAGGEALTLAESFRPLTQIALFVNALFSDLMGASGSPFDIPYADLVRGRTAEHEGRVEFHLLPEGAAQDEPADPVAEECEAVARRILELAETRYLVGNGRRDEMRPFRYRDAAILLRKRKHLRQIEHALIRYRIPYILSGGIGFYQTQEIVDFLNYFSFLLNRENDVALAGILRSPFFTLSDVTLYEISLERRGMSFWEKLQEYVRSHPSNEAAASAASILAADLVLANRLSIPLLVQRIFRVTGWRGTVSGLARGEQHAANIGKLLRIAREFEGRGLSTLYDFVERLKALVDSEEREGQASLDLGRDAVHVMTIHAAKGLEFPAVFLPFTHEPFRYDGAPLTDAEIGIGFPVRREDNLDADAVLPTLELLKARNRQRVDAEEKRVLYVATTRARDLLSISGKPAAGGTRASYLRWILGALHLSQPAPGALTLQTSPLRVLEKEGDALVSRELSIPLVVHVNPPIAVSAAPPATPGRAVLSDGDDGRYLAPLSGQTRGEFFSATQVRTYLECPSKYFLKYVLGLPESNVPPPAFDEEEEPSDIIVGEAEGAFTHAVLQEIAGGLITEAELREKILTLLAAETHLSERKRAALTDRISENVLNFAASALGRDVLAAAEVKTEFSVNAAFGEDYLTGIIDRLYRSADGLWKIIDYKTDRITPQQMAHRAELYKPQLAFYAILIRKLFRQEEIRATLVFLKEPDRPVHFDFTKAEIDAFEGVVRSVIAKIRNRDFTRSVEVCESCTYLVDGRCLHGRGKEAGGG